MKKFLSILLVVMLVLSMIPATVSAAATEITFNLGANGSASHNDGSSKTSYSETVDGYTLSITGGSNFYTGARDAKGNSCFKLGTSSKAGSFTISNIPDDVTAVTIYVAAYKAKTATVTVNGTATKLTTKSDNGQYDIITVDTSSSKSISFKVTSGYRAMVNTIVFVAQSQETDEPVVAKIGDETYATVQAAADAYVSGDVIKLVEDNEGALVLGKDIVLDLNGKTFGGEISGEYTLYGMDSATADYDISDDTVGSLTGLIQKETTVVGASATADSDAYVAIEEDGVVSFHAVAMAVTTVSFRPSTMGLYYTAVFKGDSVVQEKVEDFGVALQVSSAITDLKNATKVAVKDATFNSARSCLVYNIMKDGATNNADRAGLQIHAKAYAIFNDGEVEITSAEQSRSLQDVIEKIDELYYRMSIASRDKLLDVYDTYKADMAGWDLNFLSKDTEAAMNAQEVLEAAYQLKKGETLPDVHTLTGIITEAKEYSTQYKNIDVTIVVDNDMEHPILCFRMAGEGADQIAVGDQITVTGAITNYNGTREFEQGCTLDSWVDNTTEEPTEPEEPSNPDDPSGNTGDYVKITSMDQLTSGKYVLVASNGYAMTQYDSSAWVLSGKPTVGEGMITAENATGYIWTLTVDGASVTLTDANGVSIKPKGGNTNGILTGAYQWAVSCESDGTFRFAGVGADTVYLAQNAVDGNDNKFRGYKQTTATDSTGKYPSYFTLYKLVSK